MKKTEEKVLKFIDQKNLISRRDKILVALSGGPDSVFLFHFLLKFRKRFQIDLAVAHINHKLRGKNSDADEKFCKDLCEQNDIQFFSTRKDVKKIAAAKKISLEEAGREIRYSEFKRIAKKNKFDKIATAHNCSDNAETVLFNLIKGTGLKGLSGIPIKRENIIRPVLVLTKNEILEYLSKKNIEFRIDESNLESDFERNFIRNEIFPLIKEKLNPVFEEKIFHNSEILKSVSEQYEIIINRAAADIPKFSKGRLEVNLNKLKNFDEILYKDIFKAAVEKCFDVSLNFKNLEDILALVYKEPGTKISIPGKLTAFKERESVVFFDKNKFSDISEVSFGIGEEIKIGSMKISVKQRKNVPGKFTGNRKKEFISGDQINDKFIIRKWVKSDRFYPIGLRGTKKISDFLNEQKVSLLEKENQLVLTTRGKIVWVVGLRLDERFKVKNNTNRILELCLK